MMRLRHFIPALLLLITGGLVAQSPSTAAKEARPEAVVAKELKEIEKALQRLSAPQDCSSCKAVKPLKSKKRLPKSVLSKATVLSEVQLEAVFRQLAADSKVPFKYPEDGCYARAHWMARKMEAAGITSGKVFVFGDLKVETANSPKGYVEWWYHVAPVVYVKTKTGEQELRVIDPSLFDHPVSVTAWTEIQTRHKKQSPDIKYTSRFTYYPNTNRARWSDEDLRGMRETLQNYLEIQNSRLAVKESSSGIFLIREVYAGEGREKFVTSFKDRVREIREEGGKYRVTFELHAGVYRVAKVQGTEALIRRLQESLKSRTPVSVTADATTLELTP